MATQAALDHALDELRPGFQADGFEIHVASIEAGDVVVVRIQHRPDACEECLIPDDMLTAMLETVMRRVAPEVAAVALEHETIDG
ncbi:MAG: NifU family protein [Candidatus Rokubacteria bacterium]|nr:NifU family protein [Candidatus Rokubacteria bacterium]